MTTRTATKHADDEVFDFNLNAVEAEVELRPFRFLWGPKNRRLTMQHAEELNVWQLMERADGGDVGAVLSALETGLGKEEWTAFREIPMPQYKMKALFEAYKQHCGMGESGASSGS
ncbi:hypothetical protein ADL35_05795 [Streptomyces sp. NRRL WC-3753]|nr:hypothetical protein ADL35_05795 [Streptomyces sp. NRRL WC-3753]